MVKMCNLAITEQQAKDTIPTTFSKTTGIKVRAESMKTKHLD